MTELRCALCGTDWGKLEAQHFVTVDVVEDQEGEMLGGTPQYHNIYLCDDCRGKAKKEQSCSDYITSTIYGWAMMGITLLLFSWVSQYIEINWVQLPCIIVVMVIALALISGLYQHRRRSVKLREIAAARHGGPGPVRVFTLEQFEEFQAGRKHKDGTKSLPTLMTPKGRTVDLGDLPQLDESTQHQEKGEESQRSSH